MVAKQRHCQECGEPVSGKGAKFCSTRCRLAFNNRRMQRGAQAYDLFRAMRRERDAAKALGVWSELCKLELQWQLEDEAQRPGRRSYMPPQVALRNLREQGALPLGVVVQEKRGGKLYHNPNGISPRSNTATTNPKTAQLRPQ